MFRLTIFLGVILFLGACASWDHKAEIEGLPDEGFVFASPSLATMIIQDPKNLRKTCLGRGADAVFQESESSDFALTLVSIGNSDSDSIGEENSAGEEEMTGRSPSVLLARELFYRACELTNNANLTDKDAVKLFNAVLNVVKEGWLQEGKNTKITVGETLLNTTANNNTTTASTLQSPGSSPKPESVPQPAAPYVAPAGCVDGATGKPPTSAAEQQQFASEGSPGCS